MDELFRELVLSDGFEMAQLLADEILVGGASADEILEDEHVAVVDELLAACTEEDALPVDESQVDGHAVVAELLVACTEEDGLPADGPLADVAE